MLADVLVLEVSAHCDLPLEAAVANRAVVRQRLRVRGEMLGEMILAEESLLTHTTLIRLDTCVSHFMAAHVGAV